MAVENQIRWKQGDFITLGKAVASYNKKINKLNAEENKNYLPEIVEYSELKQNITTRKELNRVVNSLRRFTKEGAEELYITEAGQQITKWERKELGIQSRIAQKRLTSELKELNKPLSSGFSRVQMGSLRQKEIEAQLRNLKQIENKVGYEFQRLKERIANAGKLDYTMKKAIVYKENYLREMEKYSHLDNYDKLMNKLNSIKNPINFYEFASQNELTGDLTYQSDNYFSQQDFNRFIQELGIDIDIDSTEEIEDFEDEDFEDEDIENEHNYKYTLISRSGREIAHSDNKQTLINIIMKSKDPDIANGWIRKNY